MSVLQRTVGRRRLWTVLVALVVGAPGMPALGEPPRESVPPRTDDESDGDTRTAVFAGGCFWSVEKDFERAPGVIDVVAGYTGGNSRNPTYKTYASGHHREAVLVTYDPKKVTFAGLAEFLIKHTDPLDRGGSFIDRGVQYSPAIYFANEEEKAAAQRVIKAINAMRIYRSQLKVAVLPRAEFWRAEEYHQDFHSKNALVYGSYRARCGRDPYVQSVWGARVNELNLPGAYPAPDVAEAVGAVSPDEPPKRAGVVK